MRPRIRHVAITGASRGIGAALAVAYAEPGRRLSIAGRDAGLLGTVAAVCRGKGAQVAAETFDIRDSDAAAAWFRTIDRVEPVDLVIANAGVFDGNGAGDQYETVAEARRLVDVNVVGVINTVQPAMRAMRQRRQGRIAIMSSLAAVLPAPDAPTYSATKAALVAYGDALRRLLAEDGVDVTVILPGHVETRQTEVHVGQLAMMVPPDRAAEIIRRGLDRGKATIAFPRPAHWLVRLACLLPWRLKALAARGDRFYVRKPAQDDGDGGDAPPASPLSS